MFFSLFVLSKCDWWDFDYNEFPKILANSMKKPLFVLCYSPSCPHCHGLPELLRNFSENEGKRSDIYYTTIDCSSSPYCGIFKGSGTPNIVLVMGTQDKYWQKIKGRNIANWTIFVNEILGTNLREIHNEKEFELAIHEPKSGGTTFYLETPTTNHRIFSLLQSISRNYRIFNDTFVYKINPSLSHPILTAFTSPYCSFTMDPSEDLLEFINKHKFGIFHRYDAKEMLSLISTQKSVILINDRELSHSQTSSLLTLSSHYCKSIKYGWASTENEPQVLKSTGHVSWDVPFLFASDPQIGCDWFYKQKVNESMNNRFLDMINRGNCQNEINGLNYGQRNNILFYGGWIIFIIAVALVIVPYITANSPTQDKIE